MLRTSILIATLTLAGCAEWRGDVRDCGPETSAHSAQAGCGDADMIDNSLIFWLFEILSYPFLKVN